MKTKLIFIGKKNLKNPITKNQKNVIFQLCQFSIFFRKNFRDWSLGPWVFLPFVEVEPHQCSLHQFILLTQGPIPEIFAKNIENWQSWKKAIFFVLFLVFLVFGYWVFQKQNILFFLNENHHGFHMRQCLLLHYGWFLQSLEKGFIRTNMHTTVSFCWPSQECSSNSHWHLAPKCRTIYEKILLKVSLFS